MTNINDGGPAFPVEYDHQTFQPHNIAEAKRLMSGMTLRDYFAAKALQSGWLRNHRGDFGMDSTEDMARGCYEIADAMLKAR